MPDGDYDIRVGDSDGFIRCDSYLEYFLGEATYQPARKLNNIKSVDLSVFTLDAMALDRNDWNQRQRIFGATNANDSLATSNETFILDIDLDFFSTDNPFKKMFESSGTYELLKPIFRGDFFQKTFDKTTAEDELITFTAQRSHYIDCLENVFKQLEANVGVEHVQFNDCLQPVKGKLIALIEHIKQTSADESAIGWKTYFDAGCTFDSNELPAHISSSDEITALIQLFKRFLRELKSSPSVITISRSSEDDYCPPHQVDHIQTVVLEAIADVYGDKIADKPILHYNDEQWSL